MPMDPVEIERLIKEALPDAEIKLEDLVGDGDHWSATVVSSAFVGKTRVQQHQLIYQVLLELIDNFQYLILYKDLDYKNQNLHHKNHTSIDYQFHNIHSKYLDMYI